MNEGDKRKAVLRKTQYWKKIWTTTTKDKIAFTKNHLGCLDSHEQRKTCVFWEPPKFLFSSEYQKEGTRNWVNCKTLRRAFGLPLACKLWQIAAGIRENPLVTKSPETETHSFSVSGAMWSLSFWQKSFPSQNTFRMYWQHQQNVFKRTERANEHSN